VVAFDDDGLGGGLLAGVDVQHLPARRSVRGGKAIQNSGPLPAKSALSEEISKELKRRGFKFVGPVIVYAWMQAVGMVNDHAAGCFRRKAVKR
jgi:3-methyladenine DNA glycosylase Tag